VLRVIGPLPHQGAVRPLQPGSTNAAKRKPVRESNSGPVPVAGGSSGRSRTVQ
jgi:hypothetical protein